MSPLSLVRASPADLAAVGVPPERAVDRRVDDFAGPSGPARPLFGVDTIGRDVFARASTPQVLSRRVHRHRLSVSWRHLVLIAGFYRAGRTRSSRARLYSCSLPPALLGLGWLRVLGRPAGGRALPAGLPIVIYHRLRPRTRGHHPRAGAVAPRSSRRGFARSAPPTGVMCRHPPTSWRDHLTPRFTGEHPLEAALLPRGRRPAARVLCSCSPTPSRSSTTRGGSCSSRHACCSPSRFNLVGDPACRRPNPRGRIRYLAPEQDRTKDFPATVR